MQRLLKAKGIIISDDDSIFNLISLYEVAFEDMFEGSLEDTIEKKSKLNDTGKKALNVKKMQSILLLEGIRIKNDDPIFNMLGLNKIILENMADAYKDKLKLEYTHKMSINSAKREKYIIYSTCVIIVLISFFGTRNIEWIRQSLIGLGGMMFGVGLCLIFLKKFEKYSSNEISVKLTSSQKENIFVWTEQEFQRVSDMTKLSKTTKAACWDVLICGMDLDAAAAKQNLRKAQLQYGLWKFDDYK